MNHGRYGNLFIFDSIDNSVTVCENFAIRIIAKFRDYPTGMRKVTDAPRL